MRRRSTPYGLCYTRHRMVELPLLALLVIVVRTAYAMPGDSLAASPSLLDEARSVGCAGWSTITTPLHWNGTDALRAGGLLAVTGGAYLLDDEMKDLANRNVTAGLDEVERVVVRYGDTRYVVALTGGLYLAGLVASDRWLRETGLLVGTALVITTVSVQILKPVIGRARPYSGHGSSSFTPLTGDNDYQSFPSGHSTAAFTVSSVLAARIGNPWATAGLYGLASATALSRVYSNNHWFSDVVFGALAATAVGTKLVSAFEGDGTAAIGFHVVPYPSGVSLVYRF